MASQLHSEREDSLARMWREDFAIDTVTLARSLVGSYLFYRKRLVRITETEAYLGSEDPASHAFRHKTKRNAPMFGPPGHLYVYFTYGMHYCVNIVGAANGEASGILLRAGEILTWDAAAGKLESSAENASLSTSAVGPGRLGRVVGATLADSGLDLCDEASEIYVLSRPRGEEPPALGRSRRIGVAAGADQELRFFDRNAGLVSRLR